METIKGLLHDLSDFIVTEVADGTLMGVMDLMVGLELTGLNVESYLLIGIAEGHAVGCQTIHFLYREHRVVHWVVEDMLVDFYLINNVGSHLETVFQLIKGREEDLLDDLQVTKVAAGQVVHDEHHLLGQRLELVGLGTDQLEDIRVLLVGHDARTGGTLLGEFYEGEVLGVEQTGIEGQFCQGAGDGGDGEAHVTLHLAAPHLSIYHIVVHRVETQELGGHRAVEGEGRAIAGSGAQRVAVGHLIGGLQEQHVVGEALGIGPEPESEAGGHGDLKVGIAWHEHILILVALLDQLVEEDLYAVGNFLQLMTGEELQVNQHLIVARTTRVDLLSHIAQTAGEDHLHLRVDILDTLFYHKLATLCREIDVFQLSEQLGELIMLQKSDGFEHGDMCHRTQHIVFRQIEVHLTVSSDGETLYLLVDLKVLFPEFHSLMIYLSKLYIMYLCEGIGNLLDTFLEGLLYHTLNEWIELCLHRDLHLGVVLIDRQYLYPYIEGNG